MSKRILIIDDDLGLQTVLSIALRDAGYQVSTASNGEEGLALMTTARPDLVLSDVMMPLMDGVQVFDRLKEHLRAEGVPIILITALTRKDWWADLEAEGAVIVQKPFDVDYLLSVISVLLDEDV